MSYTYTPMWKGQYLQLIISFENHILLCKLQALNQVPKAHSHQSSFTIISMPHRANTDETFDQLFADDKSVIAGEEALHPEPTTTERRLANLRYLNAKAAAAADKLLAKCETKYAAHKEKKANDEVTLKERAELRNQKLKEVSERLRREGW
ncbi:hypothetical protein BT63DRAFT_457517 [Microthyrium microscopicum]|uniref:Uncharacterized protein n=1 Tax=Microthyrium microscopicum TaxID=703497 RepID=A0A6A6U2Q6_9PEZI|nr:hypothetical protein BT63DRAFT_457517 [Microthyrium microscopicum]